MWKKRFTGNEMSSPSSVGEGKFSSIIRYFSCMYTGTRTGIWIDDKIKFYTWLDLTVHVGVVMVKRLQSVGANRVPALWVKTQPPLGHYFHMQQQSLWLSWINLHLLCMRVKVEERLKRPAEASCVHIYMICMSARLGFGAGKWDPRVSHPPHLPRTLLSRWSRAAWRCHRKSLLWQPWREADRGSQAEQRQGKFTPC